MKIKETTERDCCSMRNGDLVLMLSAPTGRRFYYYCKHCGRHFRDHGGSEPESEGIQPMPWPWEKETKRYKCIVCKYTFAVSGTEECFSCPNCNGAGQIYEIINNQLDFNLTHR